MLTWCSRKKGRREGFWTMVTLSWPLQQYHTRPRWRRGRMSQLELRARGCLQLKSSQWQRRHTFSGSLLPRMTRLHPSTSSR